MSSAIDPLAATSLRPEERATLELAVRRLRAKLGDDLQAVWLYGSRARGEPPRAESDVDLLVITRGGRSGDDALVGRVVWDAAQDAGAAPAFFSVQVRDSGWLEERRRIRSFYVQEIDRDKIVLDGWP